MIVLALAAATVLLPPASAEKYKRTLITAAHAMWGLDAPVASFAAQVHQESGWNEKAKSAAGAEGLGQFTPATADWIDDAYKELGPNQPYNPTWSLNALVRYDKHLWDRIYGDLDCDRMAFVLSAFNGGEKWVIKDKAKYAAVGGDATHYWSAVEYVNAGRSSAAWTENRSYPRRILIELQPRYATWGPVTKCPAWISVKD